MNMKILFISLMLLALVTACNNTDGKGNGELLACTEDAKLCPDGTAVGRDASNNCEFFECSNEKPVLVEPDGGIGTTNPYTQYVAYDRAQCAATDWICIAGATQFFDDTGCGCKAIEPKKYVAKDLEKCKVIKFACEKNYGYFSDENGCGCAFTFENDEPSLPSEGKLQAIDCTDPRPEICTKEYMPVCGQVQVQCIRAPCYPVMQTFGNKCEACANTMTISYFTGECPTTNGNECTCPDGYRKEGESCNPECYYSEPGCLAPSIMCETSLQ
jgi:hypothetical protein